MSRVYTWAVASLLLLPVQQGMAQQFELSPAVGLHVPLTGLGRPEVSALPTSESIQTSVALGLGVGVPAGSNLVLEAQLVYLPTELEIEERSPGETDPLRVHTVDASAFIATASARLRMPWRTGSLQPYIAAGLGLVRLESSGFGVRGDSTTDAALTLGGGTCVQLDDNWGLRLEARGLIFDPSLPGDRDVQATLLILSGVTLLVG